MTSPVSSSRPIKAKSFNPRAHAFWQVIREGWVLPAVSLFVYLFLFGGSFLNMVSDARLNGATPSALYKYYLFSPLLSYALPAVFLISAMIGGVVALRFLFQKSASNAWFSIGLTRRSLFLSRFLAGAVCVLLPIALAMAADLLMNLAFFPDAGLLLVRWAQMTAGFLAQAAALYAISAAVYTLAGTLAEALSYAFVAACLPTALLIGLNALMVQFLPGCGIGAPQEMWSGFSPQLAKDLSAYNPLLFLYKYIHRYAVEGVDAAGQAQVSALPVIGWLAAAAAIAFLAYRLFKARRAEIAGVMGGNRVLGFAAVTVVAFFAFSVPYMLIPEAVRSLPTGVWLLISALAAAAVFLMLAFPLKLLGRPAWKGLLALPAALAAMFAVVGALASGGFGYSGWTPRADDVAGVSVSYSGIPAYVTKSGWGGGSGIIRSVSFRSKIKLDDPKDVSAVIGLHGAFVDAGAPAPRSGGTDPAAKVYNIRFSVEYTLKDGRKVSRLYPMMDRSLALRLTAIDGLRGAGEAFRSHITSADGDPDSLRSAEAYLSSRLLDRTVKLDLSDAQRGELLACLADDVAAQSVEDRYFPARPEVCVLDFAINSFSETEGLPDWAEHVAVTESFAKTLDFLRRSGMLDAVTAPADVDYIEVQNLFANSNYQANERYQCGLPVFMNGKTGPEALNGENGLLKIADAGQIAAILKSSRAQYMTADGGYLVYIHCRGKDFFTSAFLPMKDAPDNVKQNAK